MLAVRNFWTFPRRENGAEGGERGNKTEKALRVKTEGGERHLAKLRAGVMLLYQEHLSVPLLLGWAAPKGIPGNSGSDVLLLTFVQGA